MNVENDIQRPEAIQLIQLVDGTIRKAWKFLHALSTKSNRWYWKDYEKCSIFNVKHGNIRNCLSTTIYPIAYHFDKNLNWKGNGTHLIWPVDPEKVPTAQKKRKTLKSIEKHLNFQFKGFHKIETS